MLAMFDDTVQAENAATEEAAPPASTEVALPALETAAGSQKNGSGSKYCGWL